MVVIHDFLGFLSRFVGCAGELIYGWVLLVADDGSSDVVKGNVEGGRRL